MPARVSNSTEVKTRKRLRAQISMSRESMLHTSFDVYVHLPGSEYLAVLLRSDRDLPRSAGLQHASAFIEASTFWSKLRGSIHRSHAHRWHRGHKKLDGDI